MDFVSFVEYLKLYHRGQQNAITAKELFFFGHARKIRLLTNEARKNGYPICSDDNGYFFAENERELNTTIHRLQAQVNDTLVIVDALRSSMNNSDV